MFFLSNYVLFDFLLLVNCFDVVKNKDCKITTDNLSPLSPFTMSTLSPTRNMDNSALSDDIDDYYTIFKNPTSSLGDNSSSSTSVNVMEVEDDYDDSDNDSDVSDSDKNEDDSVFDSWEDIADSLTAFDGIQDDPKLKTKAIPINQLLNASQNCGILKTANTNQLLLKAWEPDDAFRPKSLPSMNWNYINRNENTTNEAFANQSSLCPICFEELDLTDLSFLPCSCGFHICLFCHKTIMENTGCCPQCRKKYSHVANPL